MPAVRVNRTVPGVLAGLVAEEDRQGPESEPDQAADEADEPGLGDQLADDPPARAADRALDADLPGSLVDRHRHRVDDRQAADDQADEADADDDPAEEVRDRADRFVELAGGHGRDVRQRRLEGRGEGFGTSAPAFG